MRGVLGSVSWNGRRLALGAAILSLAGASRLQAFGCEGHQIVAQIARRQLTTDAMREVDRLLRNNPIAPGLVRFCRSQGLSRFVDASTWADDVREVPEFEQTGPWHFIDIPRVDTSGDVEASCPAAGCVTRAIRAQLHILKSGSASDAEKANALRFLTHFVGDLHQPLHCADNNDRGGNCVMVKRVTASSTTRKKLHSAWDTAFVQQVMSSGVSATAAALSSRFSTEIAVWQGEPVDVDAWALASHQDAETVAYGKLPTPIAAEQPTNPPTETCPVPAKPTIQLDAAYRTAATDAIAPRLAMAGTRLALLLNDALH